MITRQFIYQITHGLITLQYSSEIYYYSSHITMPYIVYITREAGLSLGTYRYYDHLTGGLDAKGLYEDLTVSMSMQSLVLS